MKHALGFVLAAAVPLGIIGCSGSSEQQPASSAGSASSTDAPGYHDAEEGEGMSDMEKMKMELAKLSLEDAASAEAQHVCPVSGDMLGVMGAPIKIDVNGRSVWICCEGCRDAITSDPDKYLAKLDVAE